MRADDTAEITRCFEVLAEGWTVHPSLDAAPWGLSHEWLVLVRNCHTDDLPAAETHMSGRASGPPLG